MRASRSCQSPSGFTRGREQSERSPRPKLPGGPRVRDLERVEQLSDAGTNERDGVLHGGGAQHRR